MGMTGSNLKLDQTQNFGSNLNFTSEIKYLKLLSMVKPLSDMVWP